MKALHLLTTHTQHKFSLKVFCGYPYATRSCRCSLFLKQAWASNTSSSCAEDKPDKQFLSKDNGLDKFSHYSIILLQSTIYMLLIDIHSHTRPFLCFCFLWSPHLHQRQIDEASDTHQPVRAPRTCQEWRKLLAEWCSTKHSVAKAQSGTIEKGQRWTQRKNSRCKNLQKNSRP